LSIADGDRTFWPHPTPLRPTPPAPSLPPSLPRCG
jgi:hypothetical protein